ncbi:MAG TPA: M55 family metallopeptidase, partial [Tissierellia bacterium]|nr:M55 family metallopeptidase [Tissierellia bacterium]
EQALKNKIAPVKLEETYLLELRYANHSHAYKASFYPGATLVYETGVQLRVDNIFDIHRAIGFML